MFVKPEAADSFDVDFRQCDSVCEASISEWLIYVAK